MSTPHATDHLVAHSKGQEGHQPQGTRHPEQNLPGAAVTIASRSNHQGRNCWLRAHLPRTLDSRNHSTIPGDICEWVTAKCNKVASKLNNGTIIHLTWKSLLLTSELNNTLREQHFLYIRINIPLSKIYTHRRVGLNERCEATPTSEQEKLSKNQFSVSLIRGNELRS